MSYNCRSFANKTQARIYSSINIHFILINLHSVTLFLNYCYSHTHTHTHMKSCTWWWRRGEKHLWNYDCNSNTRNPLFHGFLVNREILIHKLMEYHIRSYNCMSMFCEGMNQTHLYLWYLYFKGEWCDHYQTLNTSVKGKNLYIRAWNQRNGLASFPFCREAPAWSMIHTKKGISRRE